MLRCPGRRSSASCSSPMYDVKRAMRSSGEYAKFGTEQRPLIGSLQVHRKVCRKDASPPLLRLAPVYPAAAVGVVVVESCLWQRLTRECLQLATDFRDASWLREVIANDVAEDNNDDVDDKGLGGLELPRRSHGGQRAFQWKSC
ncbi:hypothetical protein MY3296_008962 [Beauveria thailandica]